MTIKDEIKYKNISHFALKMIQNDYLKHFNNCYMSNYHQ